MRQGIVNQDPTVRGVITIIRPLNPGCSHLAYEEKVNTVLGNLLSGYLTSVDHDVMMLILYLDIKLVFRSTSLAARKSPQN